jgi:POT family proton-dependent oligopeptide transporter
LATPSNNAGPGTAGSPSDTAFFGHPRGLSPLFFTELWERFSFYGMRAILILFMTAAVTEGGLGFDTSKAGLILGTYAAGVYLMAVPGGWLADKFIGLRRAVLYGGVIIMTGHILLALPSTTTFFLGLVCVVMGTGLLKPNVSAMVGGLYSTEDMRRDAGFSIFYVGINLGGMIAPIIVGWLAQSPAWKETLASFGLSPESSWHWGFGAAAVGMFFGIIWYLAGWKHLGEVGMLPAKPANEAEARGNRTMLWVVAVGAVVLIGGAMLLSKAGILQITPEGFSKVFGTVLALSPLVLFPLMYFTGNYNAQEKKQLIVIMVLFFGATVFWSVFEQAASTLNLFADRNTDLTITLPFAIVVSLAMAIPGVLVVRWWLSLPARTAGATLFLAGISAVVLGGIAYMLTHIGQGFQSSQYQSLNSMFIVAIAPLFAALWFGLGARGKEPSSPAKFAIGLFFVAAGFAILIFAAKLSMNGVRVSPVWLVVTYLLHTVGELCLSPVGLSAMTRLAPQRIVGMVLGIWFLATSLGNYLAGFAGSMYESMSLSTLFMVVTGIALVATLIMAALVGPIKRMLERA